MENSITPPKFGEDKSYVRFGIPTPSTLCTLLDTVQLLLHMISTEDRSCAVAGAVLTGET